MSVTHPDDSVNQLANSSMLAAVIIYVTGPKDIYETVSSPRTTLTLTTELDIWVLLLT